MWPGFGENMRVLKWIVQRARGEVSAVETPLGLMPRYDDIDWRGLDFTAGQFDSVMNLDRDMWAKEITNHGELFKMLAERLPREMMSIRDLLVLNLARGNKAAEPESELVGSAVTTSS